MTNEIIAEHGNSWKEIWRKQKSRANFELWKHSLILSFVSPFEVELNFQFENANWFLLNNVCWLRFNEILIYYRSIWMCNHRIFLMNENELNFVVRKTFTD